jgi:hypothetical protein
MIYLNLRTFIWIIHLKGYFFENKYFVCALHVGALFFPV